jgi:Regulator of chromosome condensation (RCC1) repeat
MRFGRTAALAAGLVGGTLIIPAPAHAASPVVGMPDPVIVATPTLVDGPVVTEVSSGDIGTGTVTFRLSPGFIWGPSGSEQTVSVTDIGRCAKPNTLRLGPDLVQSMVIYPSGPDLTVPIGRSSRSRCRGELRFHWIAVRALHTGAGTVSYAGSAPIAGIPAGTVLSQLKTGPGPVAVGWGVNYYGEVGHLGSASYPMAFEDSRFPGVALGIADYTSYAVQADGSVLGLGRYADGTNESQVPVPVQGVTDAVAVTGGSFESLAIRRDGSVLTWHAGAAPTVVPGVTGAVAIAASDRTFFAVQGDGTLMAWGDGDGGQLGTGTRTSSTVPIAVPGLTDVVAVSAGGYGAQALTADGSVWYWGWDSVTFKPDGTGAAVTAPQRVSGLPPVKAIFGGYGGWAVARDGTVWNWSYNSGTNTTALQTVAGLTDIVQVAAVGRTTYAIAADGTMYEWGGSSTDPYGPGIVQDPTPVYGIDRVRSMVTGNGNVLAVVE